MELKTPWSARTAVPTRLAASACLLLAVQKPAAAQSADAPFDSISIALRAAQAFSQTTFERYWNSNPSAELEFETPFHLGRVQLGLHYASYDAKNDAQPDFISLFPYLGWGYAWHLSSGFAWYNGLRIGSFIQRFDTSDGNSTEQELGLAVNSRIGYALAQGWSLDLSARYRVVFTHERLGWAFLALGLSHTMQTPAWLRDLLD